MSDGKIRIDWDDIQKATGMPYRPASGHTMPATSSQRIPVGARPRDLRSLPPKMRANRLVAGQVCPLCHAPVMLGQEIRNCDQCMLVYHAECWEDNSGCATYGCTNAPGRIDQMPKNSIRVDTAFPAAEAGGGGWPDIPSDNRTPSGQSLSHYAGFWRRVGACLIDTIILSIVGCLGGGILGFLYAITTGTASGVEAIGNILGLLLGWLYYALFESSALQATPGKMSLGLIVTDSDGNRITSGRATIRHFGKIFSTLILGIGYLMAGFTQRKQCLHDMMSNCLVVMKG